MVDWSGASVTPRGFSVTEETLERTEVSEAAPRTPPGKVAGGTEINPSPCKVAFCAVDIIFFQQLLFTRSDNCIIKINIQIKGRRMLR
jgi:hypothetical protein